MIEAVECIRQVVDIRTDLVRRELLAGSFHHGNKLGQLHHQSLLGIVVRRRKRCLGDFSALLPVLIQNRFDTHDGIKDIRAGVSLEGNELVDVEDIVLARLVRQVSVF